MRLGGNVVGQEWVAAVVLIALSWPTLVHGTSRNSPMEVQKRSWGVWPSSVSSSAIVDITSIERGARNDDSFALYCEKDGVPISAFHDVPLFAYTSNNTCNMVVEIPRWTTAIMKIFTEEPLNPIKQYNKGGKLRFAPNIFPYHGSTWNFGALPQTWEDPNRLDKRTGYKGRNDLIDVCEIGCRVAKTGELLQVKVLGTFALIINGETDWKMIAIDINDPLAPQLNSIKDVRKHMPGLIEATVEWFKIYRTPNGAPVNKVALNGKVRGKKLAHKVIMDAYRSWKRLIKGKANPGNINIKSVLVPKACKKMTPMEAKMVVDNSPPPGPAQPIDPEADKWIFLPSP